MPDAVPSPPHPKSEDSRGAILHAAIGAFAELGLDGARTEAIARAAGVNKALLHYYFGTKEGLYQAALEEIFSGFTERFMGILNGPASPGERLLGYFLAHFDHLAESTPFSRLMGHEMMRVRSGQSNSIQRLVALCFGPLHAAQMAALEAGMASGELRRQEPGPALLSLLGANVFYFGSAPFFRAISGKDPRDPALVARQRRALLESAATLLFADPVQGRALAQRIHARHPGRAALRGDLS